MDNTLLGQLAVHYNLVSAADLSHCLDLQEESEPPRYLGEVLVDEGYLTKSTLERLLAAQRTRKGDDDPSSTSFISRKAVTERLREADLGAYLRMQVELEASDLHLVAGSKPRARVHGHLTPIGSPLTADDCEGLLGSMLDHDQRARLEQEQSLLLLHEVPGLGRFRVSLFRQTQGLSGVFRRIREQVPPLDTLELPPIVEQVARIPSGLVLVTGPRSSGKTTTLAAIVDLINRTRRCHVVTIERPIEYQLPSRASLISQRQIGMDAPEFGGALRSALREDPDVIVLGALSTPEQIMAAITAAETGHLVLGTMPTSTADRTIPRILDAYSGRKRNKVRNMLANVLRVVICQQLVPSKTHDGMCLATEVLCVNTAVANMIREDRLHQIPRVMQTGREQGMGLMDDALIRLVRAGRIEVAEAVCRATDRNKLLRLDPNA